MILTRENIASVDIDFLINQKIELGAADEFLLIVPTNRKVRNLKKEIISQLPNKAASGLNIETLGTLSTKLLSEWKSFKQLSEAASTVFIKQSASEINLRYLSLYKEEIPFGTLDRIRSVISEYKRSGITPNVLRREADGLEKSEKLKAIDIADIYEIYQKKCLVLNAYEIGDVYSDLMMIDETSFQKLFKKIYPGVDLVVVNGFSEFSNPEIEILRRISIIPAAKTFINFDYYSHNKLLFAHLDQCYERLERAGFSKIKDKSSSEINEFSILMREKLFIAKNLKEKIKGRDKIFKIEAFDRNDEVELIAKTVKKLIVDEKIEPSRICVVFNLIQNYSSIVKDVFAKVGLPFNLTDRTPLDNSNPVTALVNLLEIAENDFYFKNIFRALSSRFVDTSGIDMSNLYMVASELNIVAGKENWINTLNDAIANLGHAGDEDEDISDKRQSYLKAKSDIAALVDNLKIFSGKMTISVFVDHLKSFIVKSKVPLRLLQVESGQESNVRAFTDFIETVSEIFQLLEEEFGSEKNFSLSFFMDQIRTACGWARFNVKEKSNYGVQVTNLEEIRGLKYDYLFIGGLCDGDLPTRYNPEIFFSGSFKKQSFVHQTEERYRFYQSLCSWNKRLYFSYFKNEAGRETVTSTFLKDFENIFEVSRIDEMQYKDLIFSNEELQIHAGREGIESLENFASADFDSAAILRALKIDAIRSSNPFGDSAYTGNVLAEDDDGIDQQFLGELTERLKSFSVRQYSVSQLETYAKCPFKFFTERVLGIKPVEEPTEDIEAIEMGRLLHSILYEFYSTLREKNIQLVGCDDEKFRQAEKIIFDVAERQLQTTAFKSPATFYEKEKILGIGGNKKESILFRFLEAERNGEEDFIPKFFEVSFGRLKESDADKILSDPNPIVIDGIRLRGKIDRIETNEKLKSFNIVDYKLSGAKPTFDDLKNGISLQLPVYLYAASELLSKKFGGNYSPNEMFIYSLKYAVDEFGKNKVSATRKNDEIQSVEQLIGRTIEHIKNYIRSISEGKFNLSKLEDRENKVCRFCQFRTVCRIDEVN
ncbi:MAG: exodeoxyribonuclease V subunit gamma [Bacteroidetes bacterium]|nr:exodeoxyribonuclease V subunit gamma [Bacteroidota bacterium]